MTNTDSTIKSSISSAKLESPLNLGTPVSTMPPSNSGKQQAQPIPKLPSNLPKRNSSNDFKVKNNNIESPSSYIMPESGGSRKLSVGPENGQIISEKEWSRSDAVNNKRGLAGSSGPINNNSTSSSKQDRRGSFDAGSSFGSNDSVKRPVPSNGTKRPNALLYDEKYPGLSVGVKVMILSLQEKNNMCLKKLKLYRIIWVA
jgi:hypothetical protein